MNANLCNIQQFLTYFTNLFVDEVTYNIRFLTERGENVWWFDGERVNFRSDSTSRILNLMFATPDVTIPVLSAQVGISVASINKHIRQLVDKGYIERTQNGNWRLIITPSI